MAGSAPPPEPPGRPRRPAAGPTDTKAMPAVPGASEQRLLELLEATATALDRCDRERLALQRRVEELSSRPAVRTLLGWDRLRDRARREGAADTLVTAARHAAGQARRRLAGRSGRPGRGA